MNKLISGSVIFKSIITSLLYFLSSSVWAGGEAGIITYGPTTVTPVPTLSGVMLIVLALLLATIAFRILRQKENHAGRMMVLSLLAVGTLASGLGGIKLIDDAYADPLLLQLTNPNGGTIDIPNRDDYRVLNSTTVTTTILNIEINGSCGIDEPAGNPECVGGLEIAAADSCFISVGCDW